LWAFDSRLVVLDEALDTQNRQKFARQLTTGSRSVSEKLAGVVLLREGQVWHHEPEQGEGYTVPEKIVRSILHRLGCRFRLHKTKLPGRPDVVLPKHQTIVFVHGCFWHRHKKMQRCHDAQDSARVVAGQAGRQRGAGPAKSICAPADRLAGADGMGMRNGKAGKTYAAAGAAADGQRAKP
jgi:hypothetical protein